MTEKPLLVTIGRDSPDDLVEYTDPSGNKRQRMGLSRCVPYTYIDRSFADLVKYVCDPAGSDGNPTYEGTERDLALTYLSELSRPADGGLHAKRAGARLDQLFIKYADPVSKHFGQIVEPKTIDTPAGPVDCKGLDLVIARDYSGGRS